MISQLNTSALRNAYASSLGEPKEAKQTVVADKQSSTENSKVEQLKESIGSGMYKVDLQAVAQKMAQDLL